MALTNYQSFAAPAGQGFTYDGDGNPIFYDLATGQRLTTGGSGIQRNFDVESLPQSGSRLYGQLGILGQADGGLLEVDLAQNPDLAPYAQQIDGKNFVTSEVWHQLRPQNDPGLIGNLALNMPVIMAAAGGLGAAGGFFDPYSLVAGAAPSGAVATGGGLLSAADAAAIDAASMGAGGNLGAATGAAGATGAGAGSLGLSSAETAVFDTVSLPASTTAANGWVPVVAGGGSLIPGIPDNVLAGGLQGLLGLAGANVQTDALNDVATDQSDIGAPFRNILQSSYTDPNFNLWSQPGYADAFKFASDAAAKSVSATRGNPYGNPGAMGEITNQVLSGAYLPALANYRGGLMQAGGLGLNTSGQASLMGAMNAGSGLDALGYGLGTALNPQPDWAKILAGMGGNNQFKFVTA